MRKLKTGRKFSRKKDQRNALIRALLLALFTKEKIRTTEAKAKEISRISQSMITRAKKGDLATRRYLAGYFPNNLVKKIVEEIGPRYKDRKGGYIRVIKFGQRKSEGAKMAQIELIK